MVSRDLPFETIIVVFINMSYYFQQFITCVVVKNIMQYSVVLYHRFLHLKPVRSVFISYEFELQEGEEEGKEEGRRGEGGGEEEEEERRRWRGGGEEEGKRKGGRGVGVEAEEERKRR